MYRLISKRIFLYLLFLLVVDFTVSPLMHFGLIQPSFLYLLVLYVAFDWGWSKALPVAIAVGLVRDLLVSPFLGMEMITLAALVITFDWALKQFEKKTWLFRELYTFIFVFAVMWMNLIWIILIGHSEQLTFFHLKVTFLCSFYHALLMPIFFRVTTYFFQDLRRFRQYELFS